MNDAPTPDNRDTEQDKAGSWLASSRELRWIKLAATFCLILLALSLFWPEKLNHPPELPVAAPETPKPAVLKEATVLPETAPSAPDTEARQPVPASQPEKAVEKTPPPAAKPSATAAGYYVQIGAYQQRGHAEAQLNKVKSRWPARIAVRPNGMYGVWIGPYPARDKAKQSLKQLAGDKLSGFIIKHG
ncbi:MAG: SPOR domain-containing protein [Mariprofundaceae bacterium]